MSEPRTGKERCDRDLSLKWLEQQQQQFNDYGTFSYVFHTKPMITVLCFPLQKQ